MKNKFFVYKIITCLGLLFVCVSFASSALAVKNMSVYGDMEATIYEEYDGYLFKLIDNVEVELDSAADVTAVSTQRNVYLASSIDDIKEIVPRESDIAYIEPNYYIERDDSGTNAVVNDTYYSKQWGLEATNAQAILQSDLTARGVVVGVIDSGITSEHEDLDQAYIAEGKNIMDNSSNVSGSCSHGTAVTSVIAATTNNGVGMASLAYGATIVPIKDGDDSGMSIYNVATAIYTAVDTYNCDIVNISSSTTKMSDTLEEACRYAYDNGVIIIASGGNVNSDSLRYPAAYDTVIGVGAIGKDGNVLPFSHHKGIFVTAPGEDIYVLTPMTREHYERRSGTSFSAPYITSLAALAKGYDEDITFEELKALLKASAVDKGDEGYDEYYGWGVINCKKFYSNLTTDLPFGDIATDYWGYEYILHCYNNGIINGIEENFFGPEESLKRCDFITMLGRLHESKSGIIAGHKSIFSDVPTGQYYTKYVAWAEGGGIVDGYGNDLFIPHEPVTREQAAAILYRYTKHMGIDSQADLSVLSQYTDSASISPYAIGAVAWAVQSEIYIGMSISILAPDRLLTRAMGTSVLTRIAAQT